MKTASCIVCFGYLVLNSRLFWKGHQSWALPEVCPRLRMAHMHIFLHTLFLACGNCQSWQPTQPTTLPCRNSSRWSVMQSLRRLVRQFFPLAVSKNELEVLQASFLLTHEIETAHQFSFMAYLQYSVEDDFAGMAGIRVLNWLFITCYLLLTCAVGNTLPPLPPLPPSWARTLLYRSSQRHTA